MGWNNDASVPRLPLLAGSRVVVVNAPDNAVVVRPPPPVEPIADVAAAVADALRFPLAGPPLPALAPRDGRATIVVEPPALPLPGATRDPRQTALAATVDELERLGIPSKRQTLLVAGGFDGQEVTCAGCGWRYAVTTGRVSSLPQLRIETYEVTLVGDRVAVWVPFA